VVADVAFVVVGELLVELHAASPIARATAVTGSVHLAR